MGMKGKRYGERRNYHEIRDRGVSNTKVPNAGRFDRILPQKPLSNVYQVNIQVLAPNATCTTA